MRLLTRRAVFPALLAASRASAATARIALDADGMAKIDGRRTFLLGLYQLPQIADPWRAAAAAGFHVAHGKADRATLDEAQRAGMFTWATLGSISPARRAEDEARIRNIVTALRDHPALAFWETEDEPTFTWNKPEAFRIPPQVIRDTYAFVKKLDPERPLYLNHSPTHLAATLAQYNPGGDLIATDVYPVIPHGMQPQYALWPDGRQGDLLNDTISQVGQYTDKMRQVAGPSRGLLLVLQGFAWEMLREPNDRDMRMVRYPTRAETRFMAYQAIVHGATGLLWWGLYRTPPESGLWESIAATATEMKQFAAELAAPPLRTAISLEYHDTGHSLDRGIEWTLRPSGPGAAVLIAVNSDKNPVAVTFRGLAAYHRAQSLFEARQVAMGEGAFRDRFEPFGVRAYRLS